MSDSTHVRAPQPMRRLLAFAAGVGATACGKGRGADAVAKAPPPTQCRGVATSIRVRASWKEERIVDADDAAFHTRYMVFVKISAPTVPGASLVPPAWSDAPPPIASWTPTAEGGADVNLLTGDARPLHFSFATDCSGRMGIVAVTIDVPPMPGVEIEGRVVDE